MPPRQTALVDRFAEYDRLVEIGIGRRPNVARTLVDRGVEVTATDVVRRAVPRTVRFVRDDVTDPVLSVYTDSDAVYGLNLPPELHRPAADVARTVAADFLFTTLGGDQPAVPVERTMLPDGETLFRASGAGFDRGTL